jgi:hypothetical protein
MAGLPRQRTIEHCLRPDWPFGLPPWPVSIVERYQAWIATLQDNRAAPSSGSNGASQAELRLAKLAKQVERLQLDIDVDRGRLVDADEVFEWAAVAFHKTRTAVYDGLEAANIRLEGKGEADRRLILRTSADDALRPLTDLLQKLEEAKPLRPFCPPDEPGLPGVDPADPADPQPVGPDPSHAPGGPPRDPRPAVP